MSSLFGTMSIAVSALEAQQAGLQTTTNNLANLSTDGYSRQRVELQEAQPEVQGGITYGRGVQLLGITSTRSTLLDLQINDEVQQQTMANARVNTLSQAQVLFPADNSGLGQQIANFFASLNSLSTSPSDLSLRQSVLSAANRMTLTFNHIAGSLGSMADQLNLQIQQDVSTVNQLSQQIAGLNVAIAQAGTTGGNGSLTDQRAGLIQKLSGLVDLTVLSDGSSISLTTKAGAALVARGQSFQITSAIDPATGTREIYSEGKNISDQVGGGELGGLVSARDVALSSVQANLDSLASGLALQLNSAHKMGFDLQGNPGTDLFTVSSGKGAAATLAVAIDDPTQLAASSDTSQGDNGNIANLGAVAKQAVANGATPDEAYSDLVAQIGTAVDEANAESTASTAVLQQLQQQRSSATGVSQDEEAANLIMYQHAYAAAARAISAVDQMLQMAINLGVAK